MGKPVAIVLLSGGLDSATVLAIANSRGFDCHALTIRYGQRHEVELQAATKVASALGAISHQFFEIPLNQVGGSALTDNITVPKGRSATEMEKEIPVTYVPARNTVMLSIALAFAEVLKASHIFVGVNAVDYSGYPDCRPEFVEAFQALANIATKSGVEGQSLTIEAPLIHLTKPEIIQAGLGLGVDYGLTHSCYDPVDGHACRQCDSCLIRIQAFESMGMQDPVLAS